MPDFTLEKYAGPTKRVLQTELYALNRAVTGPRFFVPLTFSLRDHGKIVGGLVGDVWNTWLAFEQLWIDDAHRGQGNGTKLMRMAEDEARRLGATHVHLDTINFQAPGFYAKLGYRECGRLEDYPVGFQRIWMSKAL